MFRKLTLAAAAGAGYVLGAKAGRERYVQIEAKFREIAGMPAVQNATTTVKETGSSVADTAKATVTEKVGGATGGSDAGSSTSSTGTSSTGISSTGTSAVTGTAAGTPLDADVVVVDLGTGANTGATGPSSGARPSDTL